MSRVTQIMYACADEAQSPTLLFAARALSGMVSGPQILTTYIVRSVGVKKRSPIMLKVRVCEMVVLWALPRVADVGAWLHPLAAHASGGSHDCVGLLGGRGFGCNPRCKHHLGSIPFVSPSHSSSKRHLGSIPSPSHSSSSHTLTSAVRGAAVRVYPGAV